MRLTQSAEHAFYQTLAQNMTALLEDPRLNVKQKVEAIDKAVSENSQKLAALREARKNANDTAILRRFDKLIEMREKATKYLLSTSTWLVSQGRKIDEPLPRPVAPTYGHVSAST